MQAHSTIAPWEPSQMHAPAVIASEPSAPMSPIAQPGTMRTSPPSPSFAAMVASALPPAFPSPVQTQPLAQAAPPPPPPPPLEAPTEYPPNLPVYLRSGLAPVEPLAGGTSGATAHVSRPPPPPLESQTQYPPDIPAYLRSGMKPVEVLPSGTSHAPVAQPPAPVLAPSPQFGSRLPPLQLERAGQVLRNSGFPTAVHLQLNPYERPSPYGAPAKANMTVEQAIQTLRPPTRVSDEVVGLATFHLHRYLDARSAAREPPPTAAEAPAMLVAALAIADKGLNDKTFLNRAWSEMSGVDLKALNATELKMLTALKFEVTGARVDESYKAYEHNVLGRRWQ
jgi:hypothetical protein